MIDVEALWVPDRDEKVFKAVVRWVEVDSDVYAALVAADLGDRIRFTYGVQQHTGLELAKDPELEQKTKDSIKYGIAMQILRELDT